MKFLQMIICLNPVNQRLIFWKLELKKWACLLDSLIRENGMH